MTPADLARENAITFEAKKDALQQRQSGDWKVSFTVQGVDMDERLTRAAMGTRFVAVLVEIDDSELPIQQPAKETSTAIPIRTPAMPSLVPDKPSGEAKRQWRDMQPAQQAGIRCAEPIFAAFLKEKYPEDWRALEGNAAELVRFICGINSRAQINTSVAAKTIWLELDGQFQAWKALENA